MELGAWNLGITLEKNDRSNGRDEISSDSVKGRGSRAVAQRLTVIGLRVER